MEESIVEKRMITNSWIRSKNYGFKPTDAFDSIILDHKQIDRTLKNNQELTHTAIPIVEKLYPLFRDLGHIATIVDCNGTIIYTLGNENLAQKVQMLVGTNWHEKSRGTNAMGIALVEKNPVRVHGNRHFIESAHFLTCAASPIILRSGEMVGVINISGEIERYHPHTFLLAQMIADDIGNRISLQQTEIDHHLTIKELEHSINKYVTVPFVSLDKENRIIRANNRAKNILGQEKVGRKINKEDQFLIETIKSDCREYSRSVATFLKGAEEKHFYTFSDIKGTCPRLIRTKKMAERAAVTDIPILLTGETGTGKELFAQSIHSSSLRSHAPFIAVNCGTIAENLIESELFGYIGGSFTGSNQEGKIGKFEAAQNGTLFLDEIGDMSLRAQVTLLRALQEKEITPVGSVTSKKIDIRIIAATNKNLIEEIEKNRFRADLYYRLRGIQIILPSLRKRNDLIEIVNSILEEIGYPNKTLTEEAKRKLLLYTWPGNIRELKSTLIEAAFLSEGNGIGSQDIQIETDCTTVESGNSGDPLRDAEKMVIENYLRIAEGNISVAATGLQISRNTLYRKMKEYHIEL